MSLIPQTPAKPYKLGGISGKGFMPGKTGNPAGRPKAGMQSFKDRLAYWLDTKTLKEIKALVDEKDEKRLDKMMAVDVMVLQRVRAACRKDGREDFVAILDRLLGKPAITADLQVTHALADRLDQAEKLLAQSNAPLIEGAAFVINTELLAEDKPDVKTTSDSFEDLI